MSPPISKLVLTQVGCFISQTFHVREQIVLVTGTNCSGKSVLLEAIAQLQKGRTGTIGGTTFLGLCDGQTISIESIRQRRSIRVNDKAARKVHELLAVWGIGLKNDRLFFEGPEKQRKFLDEMCSFFDPSYSEILRTYERCIRDRVIILKDPNGMASLLDMLEDLIVNHGLELQVRRLATIARLNEALGAMNLGILSGFHYTLMQPVCPEGLKARITQSRERDRATGGCAAGPHKSYLGGTYRDMPLKNCAYSTQALGVITLHLALLSFVMQGVLTIDGVLSQFDPLTQQLFAKDLTAFLERFPKVQIWASGFSDLAHLPGQVLALQAGPPETRALQALPAQF